METDEKLEDIAMLIIANSGAGRSSSFAALEAAKAGDFTKAEALMAEADGQFHTAHEAHRELLKMDSRGEVDRVSILLAHAQDHLMASTLAQELKREIILLHKKIN